MRSKRYTITHSSLLALDEIDRINETNWARERIFQLIDHRYSTARLKRSVTLIASNSSPGELDGYFANGVNDTHFTFIHLLGRNLHASIKMQEA